MGMGDDDKIDLSRVELERREIMEKRFGGEFVSFLASRRNEGAFPRRLLQVFAYMKIIASRPLKSQGLGTD